MGCTSLIKLFLVLVNVIFLLIGLGILALGVLLQFSADFLFTILNKFLANLSSIANDAGVDVTAPPDFDTSNLQNELEKLNFLQPFSIAFIAIGAIIIIIGFLGCCGACKMNKCMLSSYACIVGVIFAALLASLIMLLTGQIIKKKDITDRIQKQIDDNYMGFGADNVQSILFNIIMIEFDCCGIDNYTDFNNSDWKEEWDEWNITSDNVAPLACCKFTGSFPDYEIDESCKMNQTQHNSNINQGCWDAIAEVVRSEEPIVIGVYAGILGFMAFCVIFAVCLCKEKRKKE